MLWLFASMLKIMVSPPARPRLAVHTLIQKHGARARAELDDTKDQCGIRFQGHVRAIRVAGHWPFGCRFLEHVEHSRGRSDQVVDGVHLEHEVQDDHHQYQGV